MAVFKKLPGFLALHLSLINHVPGKFNLFVASQSSGKTLELNPNFPYVKQKLQCFLLLHIIVRSIQSVFIFHNFDKNASGLTGDTIIQKKFLGNVGRPILRGTLSCCRKGRKYS